MIPVSFKTGAQIVIGCIIGFLIIYGLGLVADKTDTLDKDTLTPLYWILPIMGGILAFLISRFRK